MYFDPVPQGVPRLLKNGRTYSIVLSNSARNHRHLAYETSGFNDIRGRVLGTLFSDHHLFLDPLSGPQVA